MQKDARRAVKLYTEAAELGSIDALFNLAWKCVSPWGGSSTGQDKGFRILGKGGDARRFQHILCCYEGENDRAVRHFLIFAKMGEEDSLSLQIGRVCNE